MLASKSTIGKEPSGAGAGGCVTQSRSTRSRLELGVEECVTVRRDFARGDEHEERVVRRRHDVAVALESQAEEMPFLSEATGGTTIGPRTAPPRHADSVTHLLASRLLVAPLTCCTRHLVSLWPPAHIRLAL